MAICNPTSINRRKTKLHHCETEDQDFCLITETWIKKDDFDSVKKLRKAGYWCRNICRKDKIGGNTELIYKDKYNPSLLDTNR